MKKFISKFFSKKDSVSTIENYLEVDMHAHFLPSIDDGAANIEESIRLLTQLKEWGFKKCIATPHVMMDAYNNTPDKIRNTLALLKEELVKNELDIEIDASAEYFVDEGFISLIENDDLLYFGKRKYILIETNFVFESQLLKQAIFKLLTKGYQPIFAHPERYYYLHDDFKKYKEIYDLGILFQVNLASLSGYYSKQVKGFAERLIENNMVDFLGTDIHHHKHFEPLSLALSSKIFKGLESGKLLNNTLVS